MDKKEIDTKFDSMMEDFSTELMELSDKKARVKKEMDAISVKIADYRDEFKKAKQSGKDTEKMGNDIIMMQKKKEHLVNMMKAA